MNTPLKLVSLLDMITCTGYDAGLVLDTLRMAKQPPNKPITKTEVERWMLTVQSALHLSVKLKLPITRQRCLLFLSEIVVALEWDTPPPSADGAIREFDGIDIALREELTHIKYALIPANKSEYAERGDLVSESVAAKFKDRAIDLASELKDVGNCLALELNTAAVFHLVRVAEVALRKFARRLGVRVSKDNYPLEYAEWGEILAQIQEKIRHKPRGKEKDACSDIYEKLVALKECRNKVTHARTRYNDRAALNVLDSVTKMLVLLADLRIKR